MTEDHSFNGKKIVEAIGDANQDFKVLTSTKISISELLDIVNKVHSDILPKTVAEHYGNERKKTKLRENVRFSLSAPDENIPTDGYAVYGRDVKLQEEIAPIREDSTRPTRK